VKNWPPVFCRMLLWSQTQHSSAVHALALTDDGQVWSFGAKIQRGHGNEADGERNYGGFPSRG
jgi:hypothetical protein